VADDLFDDDGQFHDASDRRRAEAIGRRLDRTIRRFHGRAESHSER
jgi:hypothetical protein